MRRILTFVVLCVGIAAGASADPITFTSGTIQANDDYVASFSLLGSAFAAEGAGFGGPIVGQFGVGPLDFSGEFDVFPVNSMNTGEVTTGGETLQGFASAFFQVIADPLIIPETDRGPQVFNTPFSARGLVRLSDGFAGGNQLFSQDAIGRGTLSFTADNVGNGTYFTRSMALTFSPARSPAPTPEPGSLLLVASGLIAAWQSRRFRRS